MIQALWTSQVAAIRAKGKLPPCLAMVDVSGSMFGLPMHAAIALGLLVAELAQDPWRGRLLTFTASPSWFHIPNDMHSLADRVFEVARMPWGGSTNFVAALELVLSTAIDNRTPQEGMPHILFILTDMQFDEGCCLDVGHAQTDVDAATFIHARFREAGYEPPQVVFWNLRAGATTLFQSETDTPGVSFMAGFSAKVLSHFFATGNLPGTGAAGGSKSKGLQETPWESLWRRLSSERLHVIRQVAEKVGEGCMAGYRRHA
jgi:hypothetical protein